MSDFESFKADISNWLKDSDIQFDHDDKHWSYKIDIEGNSILVTMFALESGCVQLADLQFSTNKKKRDGLLDLINKINTRLPYGNLELNEESIYFKFSFFWNESPEIANSLSRTLGVLSYATKKYATTLRAYELGLLSRESALAKIP